MRFSSWYPLDDAGQHVPDEPGVFQIRTSQVRTYPTGRSAMAHYGWGDDLRASVLAFAASGQPDWRCRHATDLDARTPNLVCEHLLTRFRERFGTDPTAT